MIIRIPRKLAALLLIALWPASLLMLQQARADPRVVTAPTLSSITRLRTGQFTAAFSDGNSTGTDLTPTLGYVMDPSGNLLALNSDGSLKVTPSGTQTVSGTVTANAGTNLNTSALALDATLTGGTQLTRLTNGSQSADTIAGDSGQNSLLVAPARKVVPQTAQAAGALAAIDAGNYRAVSVQIVSQYSSSTVTPQCSNDNSTWTGLPLSQAGAPLGVNISSTSSTGIFYTSLLCLYFRLNITGTYTSGTFSATLAFFAQASSANVQSFSNTGQVGGSSVVSTATGVQAVGVQGATSGGGTPFHLVSANTTNSTNVKASAGQLYGYTLSNANAAVRYVKFYNKATAPTCGTDTPVLTVLVPAGASVSRSFPVGAVYGSGIGLCATTGLADNDTGAVGASDLSLDLDYK
jgi:hypothetical protein